MLNHFDVIYESEPGDQAYSAYWEAYFEDEKPRSLNLAPRERQRLEAGSESRRLTDEILRYF